MSAFAVGFVSCCVLAIALCLLAFVFLAWLGL